MSEKEAKPVAVAVGDMAIRVELPNGKMMEMKVFQLDTDSVDSLNQRADVMMKVMERQRRRAELKPLIAKRDNMLVHLQQQIDVMRSLEARTDKKSGLPHLNAQEKLAMANMDTSIKRINEDISKGQAEIDKLLAEFPDEVV